MFKGSVSLMDAAAGKSSSLSPTSGGGKSIGRTQFPQREFSAVVGYLDRVRVMLTGSNHITWQVQ